MDIIQLDSITNEQKQSNFFKMHLLMLRIVGDQKCPPTRKIRTHVQHGTPCLALPSLHLTKNVFTSYI